MWEEADWQGDYRKPIVPSEQELAENSRAKSSKLRVFEKADV